MAVFIVLWPYLLTTKLKSVIPNNLGHFIEGALYYKISPLTPPKIHTVILILVLFIFENFSTQNYLQLCSRFLVLNQIYCNFFLGTIGQSEQSDWQKRGLHQLEQSLPDGH